MTSTTPTPNQSTPARNRLKTLKRTARLIGGPAHGHTCPVPLKNRHLMIAMIIGQPEVLDLTSPEAARTLLSRAGKDWHVYEEVQALGPDANKLIPFRHAQQLPEPLERFLDTIPSSSKSVETSCAAIWQSLEALLDQTGLNHGPIQRG